MECAPATTVECPPMTTFNLADLFEQAVDAWPDREYIVAEGQRRTFAEMDARANRLAHHLAAHGVGPGDHVGEKACLASHRAVRAVSDARDGEPTRQIAASLRAGSQVRDLAGVDVYTMPTKVADQARDQLDGTWDDRSGEDYPVEVNDAAARAEVLWEVSDGVRGLADELLAQAVVDPAAVVAAAHDHGVGDLFPRWRDGDLATIAEDGKIPEHATWAERIAAGELAIDTLLNAAGLAAFTADQAALDDRIREFLGD